MTHLGTYFEIYLRAVEGVADRDGILGEDFFLVPPNPDYGYWCTPSNALTFAIMGCDGVHYAILGIDGQVTDESPVIHVSPTDSGDPYAVLGETFLEYLASGCGVSTADMIDVFEQELRCNGTLVPFLKASFDHSRLYDDLRFETLSHHLSRIEPRG